MGAVLQRPLSSRPTCRQRSGPEQVVAVAEDVGRDGHPLPTIALVGNLREGVAGLTESIVMRPSTYPA